MSHYSHQSASDGQALECLRLSDPGQESWPVQQCVGIAARIWLRFLHGPKTPKCFGISLSPDIHTRWQFATF